jgi:hypothetical protein
VTATWALAALWLGLALAASAKRVIDRAHCPVMIAG